MFLLCVVASKVVSWLSGICFVARRESDGRENGAPAAAPLWDFALERTQSILPGERPAPAGASDTEFVDRSPGHDDRNDHAAATNFRIMCVSPQR
jgi:hypothetical protein